jgi:hypothetical protein
MFKELFKLDPNSYDFIALLANTGMVIFFAVFVSMILFALTRKKKDVVRWSRIAIDDGERLEAGGSRSADNRSA